jgi:hypothetical protein
MANDTTGNPWKCDTAELVTANPVYVRRIKWLPNAEGDDILIEDNAGHDIWSLKAIAVGSDIPYWIEIEGSCNGITITTLDGGTVWIYVR